MINFNPRIAEILTRDQRFAYEAYEFVFQALDYTQKMLGRQPPPNANPAELAADARHHVKGTELLDGIRALALLEFGLMARTVFHMWGVRSTEDFGRIVFNLVEAELLSKTDGDTLADFRDAFDFDKDLVQGYRIQLDEAR